MLNEHGLTPKQELFCQEYIKDLNCTRAALSAGYSPVTAHSTGWENIRKPEISKRIQILQRERSARLGIDQDFVIRGLVMNLTRASQRVEVTDKKGKPIGTYKYDGAVVNRSLELIGKHLGMFKDKVELTGAHGGPVELRNIEDLSMEDLIRIASGATAEHTADPDDEATGGD